MQSTKRLPCDQCYDRRVRCTGYPGQPCSACTNSSLSCTRNRVRKKRGPKNSTASSKLPRHPIENAGSKIHDGQSGFTPMFAANVQTNLSPNDLGSLENTGSTTSADHAVEVISNLHAELQHGRAQIQNAKNPNQFVTVNELANFIMDNKKQDKTQTDTDWLLGLRNPSSAGHQALLNNIPTPTAASLSESIIESQNVNLPEPHGLSRCTFDFSPPLSDAHGTSVALDGTALAIATGMPLRYGPEMTRCVEVYFSRLYHVLPIIHEGLFRRLLASPPQLSPTDRGLFLAFCAATKLRSSQLSGESADLEGRELGCLFLEQHLKLRSDIDYMEEKAPSTIITSFLVHIAYACLGKPRSARHYLREAIGRAMDLGFHREESFRDFDDIETICIRRTLALLFVTERSTAIIDNLDVLLLREPPCLPDHCFDEQDRNTLTGFQCLFGLFTLLDEEIVEYWCSGTSTHRQKTESMRLKLHSIQANLSSTHFNSQTLNDFQRADILVTQQWLRLIFWQIAMRLGLLSSWSEDPAFSYNYPIELGKELCATLQSLPESALLVHHFSIYSKIFEIAYSLMDTLMLSGRREDGPGVYELKELFRYLSTSPITKMTYVRILMEKDQDQEESFPGNRPQ